VEFDSPYDKCKILFYSHKLSRKQHQRYCQKQDEERFNYMRTLSDQHGKMFVEIISCKEIMV